MRLRADFGLGAIIFAPMLKISFKNLDKSLFSHPIQMVAVC